MTKYSGWHLANLSPCIHKPHSKRLLLSGAPSPTASRYQSSTDAPETLLQLRFAMIRAWHLNKRLPRVLNATTVFRCATYCALSTNKSTPPPVKTTRVGFSVGVLAFNNMQAPTGNKNGACNIYSSCLVIQSYLKAVTLVVPYCGRHITRLPSAVCYGSIQNSIDSCQ